MDRFEGCGHILEELYDFGIGEGLGVDVVDSVVNQAYWDSTKSYARLGKKQGDYEGRRRELDIRVLDKARSELERMAGK
jgi:hypothetical protein